MSATAARTNPGHDNALHHNYRFNRGRPVSLSRTEGSATPATSATRLDKRSKLLAQRIGPERNVRAHHPGGVSRGLLQEWPPRRRCVQRRRDGILGHHDRDHPSRDISAALGVGQ
jgi:hypothetical protein